MSMEYRKLPRGDEMIGTLGLGMGGIQHSSDVEIEATIKTAIEHGINFFDLCGGASNIYKPFGKGITDNRRNVYLQMHFGAVYNAKGEYGWSRDLRRIKDTISKELDALNTDYMDFGYLHCVDDFEDLDELIQSGVFDYIKDLKRQGIVRHIGFSSHTPAVAQRILDSGVVDMFMFSINAAYDYEQGDEYGIGTVTERAELFRRAQKESVGISVMKPFHAGQLLDAKTSPFGVALTKNQCLSYVLDRPGVLCAVPGVRGLDDLRELLKFVNASREERDYSVIATFTADKIAGNCVYCNHCQPCPG